jgi:hypothetical protein
MMCQVGMQICETESQHNTLKEQVIIDYGLLHLKMDYLRLPQKVHKTNLNLVQLV